MKLWRPALPVLSQGVEENRMTDNASPRAHADLALAVYLEPHIEGRRVLLLGNAEGELADRLDRLAARLEIIDPGTREPSRGEVPELPFDDASFDLVLVCDAASLPEPTGEAVRELARVLAQRGLLALVQASQPRRRRRGPPTQVWLEKLLGAEFRNVRVLAQAELAVSALGELERAASEEFSIDSSLVRELAREPERLIGLASESRLPGEPRVWVELPDAGEGGERSDPALLEELRRAEDEAREALHRESDSLRKLESERKARLEAEQLAERARLFERKLLAAEADYDDAVARVRYFESAIGEHEAAAGHDRERREAAERELAHARRELTSAQERTTRFERERDHAKAELDAVRGELEELEQRLIDLGKHVITLEHDKKHQEETARDLLEELRRLEQDKLATVEHDARVAELEAERERAVTRALEAEVAREAAQMRADELRAALEEQSARALPEAPHAGAGFAAEARDEASRLVLEEQQAEVVALEAQLDRLRGECSGLRLRLNEAELALEAVSSPGQQLAQATREIEELRLRLAHSEAAYHALREASPSARRSEVEPADVERTRKLEQQLAAADQRLFELTRELEEADRFAELHAEDVDRFSALEGELAQTRERLEDLGDELRTSDDELHTARGELEAIQRDLERARFDAQRSAGEAAARLELAERHEAERDAARAALAEARGILSQLASRVGADENDPPSIVQAILARDDAFAPERERVLGELREELEQRDRRIEQLERFLRDAREAERPQPNDTPEH